MTWGKGTKDKINVLNIIVTPVLSTAPATPRPDSIHLSQSPSQSPDCWIACTCHSLHQYINSSGRYATATPTIFQLRFETSSNLCSSLSEFNCVLYFWLNRIPLSIFVVSRTKISCVLYFLWTFYLLSVIPVFVSFFAVCFPVFPVPWLMLNKLWTATSESWRPWQLYWYWSYWFWVSIIVLCL